MDNWLMGLLIGFGIPALSGIGIGLFAKFFPKEATFKKYFSPIAEAWAIVVFSFMGRWLKPSDMQKIDEGLFKTLAYWLDGFIHTFIAKLDFLIAEKK